MSKREAIRRAPEIALQEGRDYTIAPCWGASGQWVPVPAEDRPSESSRFLARSDGSVAVDRMTKHGPESIESIPDPGYPA